MRSRTSPIPGNVTNLSEHPNHTMSSGGNTSTKQESLRPDLWDSRYNKREIETLKQVAQQYGLDPLMREVIILQGNIYVTAAGLQKLAQRDPDYNGCQIEPVVTDWDSNFFVIKASVWKKGCDYPFEDFGDADSSTSTLQGRALFRHAITRARARAIRSAFAVPFCALEELDDEARWKAMQPGNTAKSTTHGAENTAPSNRTLLHQQPGMSGSIRLPRTYPGKKEAETAHDVPVPTETRNTEDLGNTHPISAPAHATEELVVSEQAVNDNATVAQDTDIAPEQKAEAPALLEKKASTHQQKMIQNYSQQLGWSETTLAEYLQTQHGKTTVHELTRQQASKVLDGLVEQLRKNATDTSIVVPTTKPQKKAVSGSVQEGKSGVAFSVSSGEGMQEVVEAKVTTNTTTPEVMQEVSVATPEDPSEAVGASESAIQTGTWTGEEQKRIGEDILSRMKRANNMSDLRQEWQLFQGIRGHFSSQWIDQICETKDQRKAVLSAD